MKRYAIAAVLLGAVLIATPLSTSALGSEAVYVLLQNESVFSMTQQAGELTFWEAPDVLTGQSRVNGVMTLKNETDRTVDFLLDEVQLPYDDQAALTYLDAVSITLKDGDTVLYHNTVTRLMDVDRGEICLADVAAGESRQIAVSISCGYTYTGQVPSYPSLVWTFRPQIHDKEQPTTEHTADTPIVVDWLLIAEIAGVVALLAVAAGVYIRIVRRKAQ